MSFTTLMGSNLACANTIRRLNHVSEVGSTRTTLFQIAGRRPPMGRPAHCRMEISASAFGRNYSRNEPSPRGKRHRYNPYKFGLSDSEEMFVLNQRAKEQGIVADQIKDVLERVEKEHVDWIVLSSPTMVKVFLDGWTRAHNPEFHLALVGEATTSAANALGYAGRMGKNHVHNYPYAAAMVGHLPHIVGGTNRVLYFADIMDDYPLHAMLHDVGGFSVTRVDPVVEDGHVHLKYRQEFSDLKAKSIAATGLAMPPALEPAGDPSMKAALERIFLLSSDEEN